MASHEEKPISQPLSAEEITALPRWAAVALAARCAIRLAPGFRPGRTRTTEERSSDFIVLDICQTLAALSSIQAQPPDPITANAALERANLTLNSVTGKTWELEYYVARATVAALRAAASGPNSFPAEAVAEAVVEALNAYYYVANLVGIGFDTLAEAAHFDYASLGEIDSVFPKERTPLFNRPLWTVEGHVPEGWQPVVKEWRETLATLKLQDISSRYERMSVGGGIDWNEAQKRVNEWLSKNVEPTKPVTVEKQPKRPKPTEKTPPIPEKKPQPAPTPRPPDLRMLSDEALKDEAGDRLDFKPYANALAWLINNPKTKTPLTLAINAPWGAGKTTLARMIQRRLEGKPAAGGKRPHATCWFNAWMHDDAPSLASAFAAEIARLANGLRPMWRRVVDPLPPAVLLPSDRTRRRVLLISFLFLIGLSFGIWRDPNLTVIGGLFDKEVKEGLANIISLVGPEKPAFAGLMALLFILAKAISSGTLAKSLARFIIDPKAAGLTASMKQVSDQLGNLIKQATPSGSRFVIFVDDIERCQAPRSVEVLEVVNQLLGHEGVVTVLMADMPAVAACAQIKYEKLAQIYTPSGAPETNGRGQAYGRAYLQKIIQLQFDLPPYESAKIHGLIRTLAKETPEPSATAEPSGLLPAKNWRVRLNEYLRPIVTGEAWDQFSQRLDRWLAMLLQFLTDRNVSLRELVPLVPATADWQQGFALLVELRQLRTQSSRLLFPARSIVLFALALPRWLVSRLDQWAYSRPQGWSAFWPGKIWYGFSWGLDAFCFFYLSTLLGTLVTVPAIADFFGYPAFLGRLFPELTGSRLGQWMIFDLHFSLLILAIITIGATAWLRSHIQQRRDSTIRQQYRQLISKRPESSKLDSKVFQAEVAQVLGVNVSEELLQDEIQAHVADESELRKEAEEEIMNYLPPLPRNAKRALNRLRLLLAISYERKMFGDSSGITAKHIGKWAVLSERWPELAHELSLHPDVMDTLERRAGRAKKAAFEKYLSGLTPDYTTDAALRKFCQSQPALGPIMEKLVHFEPTSPPVGTPTTQPSS